ncbi:hypothetical protein Agub_g5040, partial [Astrephomene gubernaculifera]
MGSDAAYPPPPTGSGEGESQDLWYVGAIINVIGSIAINLGTNLMKLGHNKRAKVDLPDDQKPPVRKFKEWVIGMSFFSVGNILNFVSFGFAAQSLLAALGSIQFVSNVIFASFVLHERINRMILIATTCIVGGCILLVVFGNQSSATYTVKQLTELYTKAGYVTYLSLLGVGVVGGYLLYLKGQKVVNKTGPRGFWYAILPVAYSVFSALIGTQSVLFSKSMSVILRLTFSGENQLGNWYTWLVLPLFFLTAVFWITRLNKGLRMFPAMIIVPVMQISWTLFSIISGMLYFQEYADFTPLKSVMFPIGVLVVFVGVFLLTQSASSKQASYQKMEEEAAAKAAKQDAANSAFGSSTLGEGKLAGREDSVDLRRPEGAALPVEAAARSELSDDADREVQAVATSSPQAKAYHPASRTEAEVEGARAALPGSATKQAPLDDQTDRKSMLDDMKRRIRSVQDRLNHDLVDVKTREGVRLAMGLGDSSIPAISLFAMPMMLDYAKAVNPSGRFSNSLLSPVMSSKEEISGSRDASHGSNAVVEDLEARRSAASLTLGRPAAELVHPSADSSPAIIRSGSAPASPRLGQTGLGRSIIDRAERAAKTGIQAIKKAPSNLQKAVRDKQGYGSLHEDEETGLL